MCTVSWLRSADGYVLFSNRDERRTRKAALGPRVASARGVSFIGPVDGDAGGYWIAVNQFGLSLALLNRYAPSNHTRAGDFTSRGLLLPQLLDCETSSAVVERIQKVDLDQFQPFILLAVGVEPPATLCEWSGGDLIIERDAEARMPVTSSSLIEQSVTDRRRDVFAAMKGSREAPDLALLAEFHRSHLPERGPVSVCMHRDDAETVSLSKVSVTSERVELTYHPKSPCLEAEPKTASLSRVVRMQA